MPGSGRTPARGSAKHSRSKSGVPSEESPIITGWVARESNVVDKLLNKRYAALYPTVFMTYRRDTDDSPSKVWPISAGTTVSDVKGQKYHLRHRGTSTLMAVARGKYDEMEMYGITVVWQSYTAGGDVLKLAFDTQEQAEEWRTAFADAISRQTARKPSRTDSNLSDVSSLAAEAPGQQVLEARQAEAFQTPRGGEDEQQPKAAPRAAAREAGSAPRSRAWASVLHVNGIAVYVEEQDADGEGGAIMVSAIVRAPTSDVFQNLVQLRRTEGLGVLMGARVVEKIDSNTQVITQRWKAAGALGGLCAPREVVLLRTWRRDPEDGTYIVLYQSVDHRAVPRARGGGWYAPVRVEVQAAGFTISPLMSKYVRLAGGEESQESLVTLVLKADMGGLVSERSLFGRMGGPLGAAAMRSVLEPVVTSVVILRDKVEQDRFVVRPLSMTAGEEQAEAAAAAPAPPGRGLQRTTTMLAYRKVSLAASQQQAAEEAQAAAAATPQRAGLPSVAEEGESVPPSPEAAAAEREAANAWAVCGTCPKQYWSSPGDGGFKLRGPMYLADRKKIPAQPPMFELVAADLVSLEDHMFDIARFLPSVKHSPAPFLFCVQLMVPCVPPIALVATWWVAMLIGYCAAPCDPDLPLLPPIALVATWWVT